MMKKIIVLTMTLITLMFIGCQKQEKKQQGSSGAYMQSDVPTPMEIDQLQQTAKLASNNPQAWINLGNALMDSSRFAEAIDAYQKGLELDPNNVNVRVDMGSCYRGIGKFDEAVKEFRKAIEIDPNHSNGHRNLGVVLSFDLQNPSEGILEFKKYLELSPNAPDANEIRQAIAQLSAGK